MGRWDEERNYNCAAVDEHYIQKCWLEFTTLTEEEFKNLKKLLPKKQSLSVAHNKGYTIYYENKDEYYESISEAADATKIPIHIIGSILRGHTSRKYNAHKFRYEYY